MKESAIIVGRDGRPSQLGVFGQTKNPNLKLIVRRRLPSGKEWYRVYKNNNPSQRQKVKIQAMEFPPILIRWGSRMEIDTEGKIVYNKNEALKNATDKKKSRQIFMDKGVPCPKLVDDTWTQFPVIARPLQHSKGKNFVVLKNKTQLKAHYAANKDGWYYSEFIDKQSEVRVHVAHGKVLEIMEKPKPSDSSVIAWNRAVNGNPFVRIERKQYCPKVCKVAIAAAKALGLDFCGVDVIIMNGSPFVVEANTASTLNSSPHVTQRYAQYFDWLTRSDTKRPHWNCDFKKGESYCWKNFQLNSNDNPTTETENE